MRGCLVVVTNGERRLLYVLFDHRDAEGRLEYVKLWEPSLIVEQIVQAAVRS
jgi:hypothetical protein